jgi:hypothetical protein
MNYDELAKQFGGNADAESIDYDALAKAHGASVSSEKPKRTAVQRAGDEFAGLLRGAGSIGATLVAPKDYMEDFFQKYLTGKPTEVSRNEQRRLDMTGALESMGADPNSLGFKAGKMVGEMAGVAGIPIARGGKYVVDVLKNVGSGAAAASLVDPTDAVTGGLVQGGITAAGRPLGALYQSPLGAPVRGLVKAGHHVIEPWLKGGMDQVKGRTLRELAGSKAERVAAELENAAPIVPGSYPISGEAAVNAGSTGFAAGQEALKNRFSTAEYLAREKAQEKARMDALKILGPSMGAGSDDVVLAGAQATRESAAKKNYGKAFQQTLPSDSKIEELMSRPAMQAAVARAKEVSENRGQVFSLGENKASKTIPGKLVRDELGRPQFTAEVVPGEVKQYPVSSLHTVKKALDDVINNPERFIGVGETERAAALSTRAEFLGWLSNKSKAYDFARQEHGRLSKPINQMEIMGFLENKLATPMGASERPTAFATALSDAPKTIKSATGIPRANDLSAYIGQMGKTNTDNVLGDLIRQAEYKRQASAGGMEAARVIREEFKPAEPPGLLHRGVMIARAVLERMQGKASEEALKQLAADMLDPKKSAALMRLVPEKERFALDSWARAVNSVRNPLLAASVSE